MASNSQQEVNKQLFLPVKLRNSELQIVLYCIEKPDDIYSDKFESTGDQVSKIGVKKCGSKILLILSACLENLETYFTISLTTQFVGQVADETQKWTRIYGDQTNSLIVVVVLFKES
jgi:hypothetical protein